MCGRFTLAASPDELMEHFMLTESVAYSPQYNIAPGTAVPVIIQEAGERKIVLMRWGLIPAWARDPKIGYKMINARAETVEQKPAFRDAFGRRRALIPADGFFEWAKRKGKKYPTYVSLPGRSLLAFAGIWESWRTADGEMVNSCAIITTQANTFMQDIHERMPALLTDRHQYRLWLFGGKAQAKELLRPYRDKLVAYEVSTMVNNPTMNHPACIEKVDKV